MVAFAQRTVGMLESNLFYRYGGCDYATGEADFEAKAHDESRTGTRGRRFDFFASGRCIRSGRAGSDVQQTPNYSPSHQITLGEEEIADVSLATFYVFDKENTAAAKDGVQVACAVAVVVAVAEAVVVAVVAVAAVVAVCGCCCSPGALAAFAKRDGFPLTVDKRKYMAGFDKVDPANPCLTVLRRLLRR